MFQWVQRRLGGTSAAPASPARKLVVNVTVRHGETAAPGAETTKLRIPIRSDASIRTLKEEVMRRVGLAEPMAGKLAPRPPSLALLVAPGSVQARVLQACHA
jgi:hypothetical protein